MLSEIGSNFWINPHERLEDKPLGTPERFGCKGEDYVWLSTGRSSISFAIKTIEERNPQLKRTAVLPPFTCHTVIEPFLNNGYEVVHYPVNEKLETTDELILQCALDHDASVVLFHRYYGFHTVNNADKLCDELRKRNKFSIEDCTQCLYDGNAKSSADFCVGSIRKWQGTPDGGFTVCREGNLNDKPEQTDVTLEQAKVKASYAKYRFLFEHEGEKPAFLQLYREAEDILEAQNVFQRISHTSEQMQSSLDVNYLCERRRKNFMILLEGLKGVDMVHPLFDSIGEDVVPLYFPMLVKDRVSLQAHLVKHSIYAPVVWPKPDCIGKICKEADDLYQHLLCIPIDQRYGEDDMNRVVETIKNYSRNE